MTAGSASRPSPESPPARCPTRRRHDPDAPTGQGGQVLAHGRVLPHLGVHGGTDQHRGPRGQQGRRQKVVGKPGGVAGQEMGRGRHHDDEVGTLSETGVGNG